MLWLFDIVFVSVESEICHAQNVLHHWRTQNCCEDLICGCCVNIQMPHQLTTKTSSATTPLDRSHAPTLARPALRHEHLFRVFSCSYTGSLVPSVAARMSFPRIELPHISIQHTCVALKQGDTPPSDQSLACKYSINTANHLLGRSRQLISFPFLSCLNSGKGQPYLSWEGSPHCCRGKHSRCET